MVILRPLLAHNIKKTLSYSIPKNCGSNSLSGCLLIGPPKVVIIIQAGNQNSAVGTS